MTEESTGDDRMPGRRSDEVDVVGLHTPSSWRTWVLLLLGPVVWATHFMGVYLVVEAWCSAATDSLPTWLGASAPVAVTLVATVLALVVIGTGTAFTARRLRQSRVGAALVPEGATDVDEHLVRDRPLLYAGLLLGPLSAITVLVVGLPALWVQTC